MQKKIIWEIIDDRAGNYRQVQALSSIIENYITSDIEIISKKIKYNKFIHLPNILQKKDFLTIDKESKKNLYNQVSPDIIISAGRRSAPILLALKKKYPSSKIIQIMWPENSVEKFDLIIIPSHDKYQTKNNIVKIDGALSYFSDEFLLQEKEMWKEEFSLYSNPLTVLLLGGNSKHANFTDSDMIKLANLLNQKINNEKGDLVILNSRRTEKAHMQLLQTHLRCKYKLYDWQTIKKNPYIASLLYADDVIVTLDSMSMCAESAFLSKNTLLYQPTKCGEKSKKFAEILIQNDYATMFCDAINQRKETQQKLNNAEKIINIIKNKCF